MVRCWAKEMGSCSNTQSSEHLVSSCYFDTKHVVVHSLPWASKGGTTVGKKKLTSNILCNYHNSALSLLDQEGRKISDFIRESHRRGYNIVRELNNKRISEKEAKNLSPYMRLLNGHILEKWLLKTAINYVYAYRLDCYIGDSDTARYPSKKLLKIIFYNERFTNKSGLYFLNNSGASLKNRATISLNEVIYEDETAKRIIGFEFYIWEWRFFLSLVPDKFVLEKQTIILPSGLRNKDLRYRKSCVQGNILNRDGKPLFLCSKLRLKW